MCTALILTPVSRKSVSNSMLFFTTNNNTVVISNLAPPAWNSITRFDANYLMFCLFGDTLSFMMFSSFSSAVLLLHNQTQPFMQCLNSFWKRRPGTSKTLAGHVTRFKMAEDVARSFLFQVFPHLCKEATGYMSRSKSKGKSFMEIILSSKYSWKRNRFSIVIVNICETRNEWLMSYDLSGVIVWRHW